MAQQTELTAIKHSDYQKKTRGMTDAQLRFVIADCRAAIEALPNGHKVKTKLLLIRSYCCMELKRRI